MTQVRLTGEISAGTLNRDEMLYKRANLKHVSVRFNLSKQQDWEEDPSIHLSGRQQPGTGLCALPGLGHQCIYSESWKKVRDGIRKAVLWKQSMQNPPRQN